MSYTSALIREQDPLKQGLKLIFAMPAASNPIHSRARSIKTRIETYPVVLFVYINSIREQDPLKQGLKPQLPGQGSIRTWQIREQDPLKQGLKQFCDIPLKFIDFIREQDPLKQGLKQEYNTNNPYNELIREQDPLKQGLKLCIFIYSSTAKNYSRARSIKTRIETGSWREKIE